MGYTAAPASLLADLRAERARRAALAALKTAEPPPPIWTPYEGRPQDWAYHSEANILGFGGAAGGGKALDLDTPLPTPAGWTTMGAVRVGDELLDERGMPCRVTAVSEVFSDHDCYLLAFDDGTEIVADADHRWPISLLADGRPDLTLLTSRQVNALFLSRPFPGRHPLVPIAAPPSLVPHGLRADRPDAPRHHAVVGIVPVRPRPVKCVSVDSPSRLYLAGPGKVATHNSDLELGLALTAHRKSIIFRKEAPQLRSLIERSREIIGDRGRFNENLGIWRLNDGRIIELASIPHDKDVSKYRGRDHDLKCYDEAQDLNEFKFRFTMGWLRSATPGQRCRAVLGFNPPSTPEGRWLIKFFAPWLDKKHPNPAVPGELRWFAMVDGVEVERPDGAPFDHGKERITPTSRTFFPARLADNPVLHASGYETRLQALEEPLRSQLLYGDFAAGELDDAWQAIPTRSVVAAQERWAARAEPGRLDAAGLDVAHGGKDKTVLSRRYGAWFAPLDVWAGAETPTGNAAAERVAPLVAGVRQQVNVDAIGVGCSAYERLREDYDLPARSVDFASSSHHCDRTGTFSMANMRAEAYWRLREALDPQTGDDLALPPDPEILADLTAVRYKVTPRGILIESKDDLRRRIGRSPDKGDAIALALLPPSGPYVPSEGYGRDVQPETSFHPRMGTRFAPRAEFSDKLNRR